MASVLGLIVVEVSNMDVLVLDVSVVLLRDPGTIRMIVMLVDELLSAR